MGPSVDTLPTTTPRVISDKMKMVLLREQNVVSDSGHRKVQIRRPRFAPAALQNLSTKFKFYFPERGDGALQDHRVGIRIPDPPVPQQF